MTKDAYISAPDNESAFDEKQASIFVAVLMILGITLAIAAILAAIEYLVNFKMPGGTVLTSLVPVGIAGYIYGRRKEIRFTRAFRIKVIAVWYLFSISVSALVVFFIGLDLTTVTSGAGYFGAIFVGLILLSALFSYLVFGYGNTLALKALTKQSREGA